MPSSPSSWTTETLVPLRDGVRLATTITLPDPGYRGPALLVRTPYGRRDLPAATLGVEVGAVLAAGLAVVRQDVRGRGESEGVFGFVAQERADGCDTLDWLSRQAWSDGRFCLLGASYPGRTQLLIGAHPAVVALAPAMAGLTSRETWWPSGVLDVGIVANWTTALVRGALAADPAPSPQATCARELIDGVDRGDVARAALAATGWLAGALAPIAPHLAPAGDPPSAQADPPGAPSLHVTGWFDPLAEATIMAWERSCGPDHHLVVGPWTHDGADPGFAGRTHPGGDPRAWGLGVRQLEFLAAHARAERCALPRAQVYVTGADVWRELPAWPPATTAAERFLAVGDVGLRDAVADGATVTLTGRADDPVRWSPGGISPGDLRGRPDVAVFAATPLGAPLELAGTPSVELLVEADRTPVGFVARLIEYGDPDAPARVLAAGAASGPPASAGPLSLVASLSPLHHIVSPQHRLALVITPSDATSSLLGRDVDRTTRIGLGGRRPSVLRLPVVIPSS